MTTAIEMLGFVQHARDLRQAEALFLRTLDPRLRVELMNLRLRFDAEAAALAGRLMLDVAEAEREAAERDQEHAGAQPNCPKCGCPMQGGAPHGPWPVQWECRVCGTVVVPPSPGATEARDLVGELAEVRFTEPLDSVAIAALILRAKKLFGGIERADDLRHDRLAADVAATAADPSHYGPRERVGHSPTRAPEGGER